jgi:hypothetical protein
MNKTTNSKVPALNINKVLYKDRPISTERKLEQLIVWRLMEHMATYGWLPYNVWDGDEYVEVSSAKGAMEVIFNLDEARLILKSDTHQTEHGVVLVLGNGFDIISDWGFTQDDPDGFCEAMEEFDSEDVI